MARVILNEIFNFGFLAQIKETILRRPDFYIPMIIRCCGNKMADLHRKNRTKMLYRLIAALKSNGK